MFTAQWEHRCAVPVIPTAGVGLYGTGQRLEGSLVEGSVRIARVETIYMAQWEHRCAVPVIPTAGVALYGTGQRLEGSLVEGSVRIAHGDDLHGTVENNSAEQLCHARYFLTVASRRSVQV